MGQNKINIHKEQYLYQNLKRKIKKASFKRNL